MPTDDSAAKEGAHEPFLSIVILAYNEEENLPYQAGECLRWFDRLGERPEGVWPSRAAAGWDERGASGELVVVNDGSADRTGAIADELAAKDPRVRAVHHPTNRGMGAVIRSGYAASTGRYVTQLPADAQVGPDTLEGLLPLLDEAEAVLSVYRARDDGKKRALMSFVFQGLVRVLFGHDGRITGTMILRRELVERFPIKSNTFFANLELPFRIMDAGVETRVTEIEARPRRSGESKVARPGRILRVVRELVRIRLQEW